MKHFNSLLLCIFTLFLHTLAQESVHIRSPYGLGLTSSTLRWATAFIETDSDAIDAVPVNGDSADANSSYICRARHGGHNIIGSTNARLCQIAYFGEVYSYPSYELLTNPSSFARLDWQPWTKFYLIPDGALETRLSYVSRVEQDGHFYGGRLDSTLGRGKILTVINGEVKETTEGELLVETEPTAYEIADFSPSSGKVKTKVQVDEEILLAVTTLANEESEPVSTVSTVLFYDIPYKVYLIHVRGLVKGLSTKIRSAALPNAITTDWSKEAEGKFSRQTKEVSYDLDLGTAVNVTLKGRRIVQEAPYSAKLFAKYPDGKEIIHNLEGIMRSDWITDIKVDYSAVYFIGNNSIAPTTIRTTTAEATEQIDYAEYDYMNHQTDNNTSTSERTKSKKVPYTLQAKSGNSSANILSFSIITALLMLFVVI